MGLGFGEAAGHVSLGVFDTARQGAEVTGAQVLLVDDVYTTGLDRGAARVPCLRGGARGQCVTFARVASPVRNTNMLKNRWFAEEQLEIRYGDVSSTPTISAELCHRSQAGCWTEKGVGATLSMNATTFFAQT